MSKMAQQVAWITGASSGIGEAVAVELAKRGARLILSARRESELQRVAARCYEAGAAESAVHILALDVTDEAALAPTVERALAQFGHVDLLFNNAGISQRSFFQDTDMSVYRKIFEVDFFGQIALTKLLLPSMLERRSGHIAVTASVAGKIGVASRTGYCAAKHAVMGFFDALRAEVDHQGIVVSTVVPGFIRTPISNHALTQDGGEMGKMDSDIAAGMDVDDAARVIVNGFERQQKEINVGKGTEMLALKLKRLMPSLVFGAAAKRGQRERQASKLG